MKIYLIGMPGSGKSTLGKQLAASLKIPFIDLDQEIEKREQRSISEIFSQDGEETFRKIESGLLNAFATDNTSFVMATGGGAPCFYDGIKTINKSGLSIFIDTPLETLVRHTINRSHRPLLQSQNEGEMSENLSTLRAKRLSFYQQANATITGPDLRLALEAVEIRR